jgi:hypothetical protein
MIPPNIKASSFIIFFDVYSNFFTAVASIGAIVAIFISIIAIRKASNDNRKQILIAKYEEIYQLIVCLSVEYIYLYDIYIILEKANSEVVPMSTRIHLNSIKKELEESIGEIALEDLYQKTIRLNVLANAYLIKDIKYDVISYSQLFASIIHVLKTGDLKAKENEFPEVLPVEEKVLEVTEDITMALVLEINLGTPNKGYRTYRDTKFKAKLGIMKLPETN